MIEITNTEIYGWETAIRGMRNPMDSWDKSDSYPAYDCKKCGRIEREGICEPRGRDCSEFKCFAIGEKDLALMKRLIKGGTEHRKFLRMVNVTFDITAPLYWWKEFDTYKVGTVANSCSTMHTVHKKEFTLDDFSTDKMSSYARDILEDFIFSLNTYRESFLKHGDKTDWYDIIQSLPSSYNQKRTVQLNYEVLLTQYRQRKGHKLDEWRTFCQVIENLPYMSEFLEVTK